MCITFTYNIQSSRVKYNYQLISKTLKLKIAFLNNINFDFVPAVGSLSIAHCPSRSIININDLGVRYAKRGLATLAVRVLDHCSIALLQSLRSLVCVCPTLI